MHNIVILGAAGRDFHNFNVAYRDDASVRVVAFTAAQIPNISGRSYPAAFAGALYSDGIPICEESALEELCRQHQVAEVVDPRLHAAPAIAAVYRQHPHIRRELPAVGYSAAQLDALAATINGAEADVVVAATPIDLARLVRLDKPVVCARYDFAEAGEPSLASVLDEILSRH